MRLIKIPVAQIKREINKLNKSSIVEEKSYNELS
jgi:hypothetical protein|tara:strand:+ start:617 stop:718 length:102 start_codon:yes stop_codon:yes gene_type:complete